MVAEGYAGKRRARPEKGRVYLEGPAADCPLAEGVGQASHRRKSSPYRSAMSMLTFYINRGGKDLPARQKKVLEKAKDELRTLFDKD
jgi:hypothetical protein